MSGSSWSQMNDEWRKDLLTVTGLNTEHADFCITFKSVIANTFGQYDIFSGLIRKKHITPSIHPSISTFKRFLLQNSRTDLNQTTRSILGLGVTKPLIWS